MSLITQFVPDPDRQNVLKDCIDNYDVGEDEDAEWPNNILSRRTVVYGNGTIARQEDEIVFAVESDELELCVRLANEAAALVAEESVGMGSESGAGFSAFWVCANEGNTPTRIDENLIRERFGNTIFPPATIKVEPMSEESDMFQSVRTDVGDAQEDDPENADEYGRVLDKWRALFGWFDVQDSFHDTACVSIGDQKQFWSLPKEEYPLGTELTPCVMPRLLLGLTARGSLCGLFGFVVQT